MRKPRDDAGGQSATVPMLLMGNLINLPHTSIVTVPFLPAKSAWLVTGIPGV